MKILIATVILAIAGTANAEIYKCLDDKGRPQFSDRPCSENAEIIEVKDHTAGISHGPQGDFSKVHDDIEKRDIERKIGWREDEIDAFERIRDQKIGEIKRKQSHANNNLAGATWEQSLATEMDAVANDYNSRIDRKHQEIDRLRDRMARLKEDRRRQDAE